MANLKSAKCAYRVSGQQDMGVLMNTVYWFVHLLCLCLTQSCRVRVPAIRASTVESVFPSGQRITN